ncbi:uncharacterized protein LOC125678476 isoform X2 [Ostrea edulis]|uniref:uncharacterized protein LOC125678476 isoform X2 n=1 Tax=Ostrea edulis TaxID=37623 RepID=UPI0024AF68B6|nr:uncharacterized protein LOC125678476 isoform X2 [Ostrea edulis]
MHNVTTRQYENIDEDGDETEVNLCDLSVHRGRKQLFRRKTKGFGHSKLRSTPREGDIQSSGQGWSRPREGDIQSSGQDWSRPREGDIQSSGQGWSRPREGDIQSSGQDWSRPREGDIQSSGQGWSRPREGDIQSSGQGWSRPTEGDIQSSGHGFSGPREANMGSRGHGWNAPRQYDIESRGHGSRPREGNMESKDDNWTRPREGNMASRGWNAGRHGDIESRGQKIVNHHCLQHNQQREVFQQQPTDLQAPDHYGSSKLKDPWDSHLYLESHSSNGEPYGMGSRFNTGEDRREVDPFPDDISRIQCLNETYKDVLSLFGPDVEEEISDAETLMTTSESEDSSDEDNEGVSESLSSSEESEDEWMYKSKEGKKNSHGRIQESPRMESYFASSEDSSGYHSSDIPSFVNDRNRIHKQYRCQEPMVNFRQVKSYLMSGDSELVRVKRLDYRYQIQDLHQTDGKRNTVQSKSKNRLVAEQDSIQRRANGYIEDKDKPRRGVNTQKCPGTLTGDVTSVKTRQLSRSKSLNIDEYETFRDLPRITNAFSEYPNIQELKEGNPQLYKQPMSSFEKVTKWIMPPEYVNDTETNRSSFDGFRGRNGTRQTFTCLPSHRTPSSRHPPSHSTPGTPSSRHPPSHTTPGTPSSRHPPSHTTPVAKTTTDVLARSPRHSTVFSSPKAQSYPSSPQTVRGNVSNSPSSSLARLHLLSPRSSPRALGVCHKKSDFENDSFCQSVPPMFKVPDAFPYQKSPSTRDRVWRSCNVEENQRGGKGHLRSSSFDSLSSDRICSSSRSVNEHATYTRKKEDMQRIESENVVSAHSFARCQGDGVDGGVLNVNRQDWRSNSRSRCCHENPQPGSLQSVKRWRPKFIGSLFPVDRQNLNESTYFQKSCTDEKDSDEEEILLI